MLLTVVQTPEQILKAQPELRTVFPLGCTLPLRAKTEEEKMRLIGVRKALLPQIVSTIGRENIAAARRGEEGEFKVATRMRNITCRGCVVRNCKNHPFLKRTNGAVAH